MKNQTNALITILGLLTIILVMLFIKFQSVTNVYCGENTRYPSDPNCRVSPFPNEIKSADDVMLYYKIDDNCNLQTLLFDSEDENPYTVIGRFEGKHLPNGKYELSKLFAKLYGLGQTEDSYRIKRISVKEKSSPDHIFFNLELESVKGSDRTGAAYVYGDNPGEQKIIISNDAYIDFEVTGLLPFTGGGYECNGKATMRNPGNQ